MKICTGVELQDVIMDLEFKFEKKIRDFDVIGVKIHPFPLTLHVGLGYMTLPGPSVPGPPL